MITLRLELPYTMEQPGIHRTQTPTPQYHEVARLLLQTP